MRARPSSDIALVSMPWMSPTMPSIQLATLAAALADHGIAADRYELYLDYAARVGVNLSKIMGGQSGFVPEWVFSRHYYRDSRPDRINEFRATRPRIGLASRELEDEVLEALCVATDAFLEDIAADVPWADYSAIGFTLTVSQLGPSMAMARMVRRVAPETTIIFGGTACAGPMGPAILRACAEADVIVAADGEDILPEIVRRLAAGQDLNGMAGVHWRDGDEIHSGPAGSPVHPGKVKSLLDYDPYFARLDRLGLRDAVEVWLPFEGSRGCWYGEKAQCTFCGLHEIMKFRSQDGERVLAQLDFLRHRYGVTKFFGVDLILPKEFHETLLPALARRPEKWDIFYEVKADLTEEQFALMAAAGITWIQPGIESLDHDILRLMRKGVRPTHNIQILRWSKEQNIQVSWNLITGIPGARPEMYQRMTALFPLLHHLPPPTGVGDFQLHRFSPYWDNAQDYGIERLGAHPLFRGVFPVPEQHLDDLVYWHDFRLAGGDRSAAADTAIADLAAAAKAWLLAFRAGAELSILSADDGRAVITDKRAGDARRFELDSDEAALYAVLSSSRRRSVIMKELDRVSPGHRMTDEAVQRTIGTWADAGLVYTERERVLALAVRPAADRSAALVAPHGYLE
jgi:ribosomal peptide maturation radical SAM protein 1